MTVMAREARQLWQQAFEHVDHLCNGLCPDYSDPGMATRDPACFYCRVMVFLETQAAEPGENAQ